MITPVFDAPLLLVEGDERVLVAADLHLGLEYELWRGGVSIPSQTEKILARLLGFLAEIKPDRLLLLGDIKHNVPKTSWQEKREIPEFLRRLCAQVLVEIVPGNHDSNLADMAPLGVRVRPSSGFVLDGVGYFHGHTWPDEKVMRADSLVAGTWTWWNTSSSPFIRENAATHWDLKKAYQLTPHSGKVKATAPGRIHLTVLDMNRFAPNRPGGGGVGFALQIYCSAEVECTSSCLEIDYSREPIIRHFAEVFKKAVHYQGGFKIAIQDHERKHVGLGSTGSVLLALGHALNAALGSPLNSDQIRLLLGNNYVEETEDGRVTSGFETGVGPAAATYGGMVITGDELALAYRHRFAEGKNVFVTIPPTVVSSAGRAEFDLLMNRARNLDYQDRELKAYLLLMDLIPALEREDLKKMGDIIWEIEFRGSKRAEVEHHGFEIYRHMSLLRESGLEFVGMSSVGPSIAIVTDRSREEVAKLIEPLGLKIAIETKVDNGGLKIIYF